MEEIGDRIRAAREARGLSPTDLARKMKADKGVEITPQAIYQIESGGTKNPKPQNLLAIVEVLEADIVQIITGQPSKAKQPRLTEPANGVRNDADDFARGAELIRLYGLVAPPLRERVYKAARQAIIDVGRVVEADAVARRQS
jgi:transcriptional regulator with XRE-family HTH domain